VTTFYTYSQPTLEEAAEEAIRRRARYGAGGAPAARRGRYRALARDDAPDHRQAVKFPQRHWRSYGNDPLPTPADALVEPFRAFPSWFLRIECDRCGRVQMVNEAHAKWRDRTLRDILARMRHDGCGGLAAKAELLTGIEGVSSRPVRRIVLINPVLTGHCL
jgi:hypothetical protein